MSTAYTIPLISGPQTFTISLAGIQYIFTIRWNDVSNCWVLDIADQNSDPLVSSLPMITGTDLLAQRRFLGIGGSLIVSSTNNPATIPDETSLGNTGKLYFVTNP